MFVRPRAAERGLQFFLLPPRRTECAPNSPDAPCPPGIAYYERSGFARPAQISLPIHESALVVADKPATPGGLRFQPSSPLDADTR